MKPYIICHILSALDGKIAGDFMRTTANQNASNEYGRIREEFKTQAWLYGTTTTKEFTGFRKPVFESLSEEEPDGDYVAETGWDLYYVSVDTLGEIAWDSGTHGGSGFSGTQETIAELEPNATMLEGKSISRNSIEGAEQEIIDWFDSIGMLKAGN